MKAVDILDRAKAIVDGRRNTYGQPERSFAKVARLWNAHAKNRGFKAKFSEQDVAIMMAQLKQVRLTDDPTHPDSQIDYVGYAALAGEVANEHAPQPAIDLLYKHMGAQLSEDDGA